MKNTEEKLIPNIVKEINDKFGKEVIFYQNTTGDVVSTLDSGSLLLNHISGGGYPIGRLVEIYGPESAGKTTLTITAIKHCTGEKMIAFLDIERSFDWNYALKLGVDISRLLVCYPNSGEEAWEIIEALIKSKTVSVIIIDSIAALLPEIELKGEISDKTIGEQARLISRALRKIIPLLHFYRVLLLVTNQLREKVGVIFGNPEITPGGRALRFYTSLRIEVRRGENIIQDQHIIGHKIKVKVTKNKVAPPLQTAELSFYFKKGICTFSEIIELGLIKNVITRNGAWFYFENEKIGQGKRNLSETLKKDPTLLKKITEKINEN